MTRMLAIAVVLLSLSTATRAELIVLRSGNGTIGGTDSLVNMLVGPISSAFPSAFTATDFTNARTGPDAFIVAPNPIWVPGLAGDNSAKWISTRPNGGNSDAATGLYAIDFTLNQPVASATLDLNFAVDNFLGGPPSGPLVNQGVFLNGTAISGNSSAGNTSYTELTIFRTDIAPLLNVGINTLYLNVVDVGGPSGVIFRATITTTTTAVPEPSSVISAALGLAALAGYAGWRRVRPRMRS